MLGIVIGSTVYPAISAPLLLEHCEQIGLDTSWWVDDANVVELQGGLGPSEALLLLPYSTIQLLNDPIPSQDHGDEEGLDGDGDVDTEGANYYDRVIRIFQCIKENPSFDTEEEEDPVENPRFITEAQDLKGWTFVSSRAIDPQKLNTNTSTVHLARFVNSLQGLSEVIGGTRSTNRNPVVGWNKTDTAKDAWGFTISNDETKWAAVKSSMWEDVQFHFPNTKFEEDPITFVFPEFPEAEEEDYFNDRPHNLNFKDLTPWEAFVEFCHKISHEIFPTFNGTMVVKTIDAHANESSAWASDDPSRPLELMFGEDLYTRVRFLIDHDHPPSSVLVPHSFTAVFSRTITGEEILAVPPIALWRGPGDTSVTGGLLPIFEPGLFTQLLVQDTDVFDADFLEDHPYVMSGDYFDQHGEDRAVRSRTQYLDCTFFAMLTEDNEGQLANIDRADSGLRHPASAEYLYPLPDIANLIAKRHLKAILMGDLGTVTLSGLHNFEPNTRHQTIRFDAGISGPITSLIGYYRPNAVFPREVTTRNLQFDSDFTGLAVVVDLTPADHASLSFLDPTGASGDFTSFEQPTTSGQALPISINNDDALVADGDETETFLVARNDTLIAPGTIIFIKNQIAHAISACDYIRNVPNGSVDLEVDKVLVKQSDGSIVWSTAEEFEGPEGPTGGGTGDSVAAGYAIDTTGTPKVIDFDPTELTDFSDVSNTIQFFHYYFDDPGHTGTRTDPAWKTVTNYDPSKDQMWWHRSGSFRFQTTDDYDTGEMQMLVNFSSSWKWIETIDYNDNTEQILWHRRDADTAKRWQWITTTDYNAAATQLLGQVTDVWYWKTLEDWLKTLTGWSAGAYQVLSHGPGEEPQWHTLVDEVINNPTDIELNLGTTALEVVLPHVPVTFKVWPDPANGSPADFDDNVTVTDCQDV